MDRSGIRRRPMLISGTHAAPPYPYIILNMQENPDSSNGQYLAAEALSCQRNYRELFADLSFRLHAHEVLLVEGRNGSGKTTLLRTIAGIRRADAGQLTWCGTPIEKLGADFHEHIAYVGHLDGVKADLTAYENLRVARALGKPADISLDDALAQVELLDRADVLTQNLSAGQRRRLALARLLVTDATLWVLDEPFTALDKQGRAAFERLMQQHTQKGGMVVLSSHHDINLHDQKIQRINLSA